TPLSPGRRRAANALLAAGYGLAGWAGLRFVPMWRQRRARRFVAFEAGTGLVAIGLVVRGRPLEAAANAITATALGLAWVVRDRLRRRP
ncbi:MAG: hypothetical protein ACRD2W_19470, partial [Acidimicrobiales bacterium]